MNVDTGEIRPWDSLTVAEQRSGRWVKLPSHDDDGRPVMAQRDDAGFMRQFLGDVPRAERYVPPEFMPASRAGIPGAPGSERRTGFDALGRPR